MALPFGVAWVPSLPCQNHWLGVLIYYLFFNNTYMYKQTNKQKIRTNQTKHSRGTQKVVLEQSWTKLSENRLDLWTWIGPMKRYRGSAKEILATQNFQHTVAALRAECEEDNSALVSDLGISKTSLLHWDLEGSLLLTALGSQCL